MNVKEYLNKVWKIEYDIEFYRNHIRELNELRGSLASPGFNEHVTTGQRCDAPFVKTIIEIMDQEKRLAEKLEAAVKLKSDVSNIIESIEDPDEKAVLRERYLHCQTWIEIAGILGVSERTVRRLHDRACAHITVPLG